MVRIYEDLMEWRVIIMNVEEAVPKEKNKEKELISRKEEQNKNKTHETEDSEDELFEETPAKKIKFHRKRGQEKRTPKDTTIAKKFARKRIHEQRSKNKSTESERGGADDQTHLAMALQISEEVERNRLQELEAELFVTDSEFERSANDVNNDTSEKIVEDEMIGNVDYEARKISVSDIFADTVERIQDEDTSSEEYFNRQPSGRVASSPSLSISPPNSNFLCSSLNLDAISSPNFDSSSEDDIVRNTSGTPTASRQYYSSISPESTVARTPTVVRKSVIVKHLTIAESPEKVVINKTLDMTRKCEKLKPKNRYMKIARYSLDRKKDFMDQSNSETDTDEDDKNLQKDLDLCRIIPKKVANSIKKDLKIETPVNLQLESISKDGIQTLARMSDSVYIYEFVVSKKLDFLLENHIKPNTVMTVTEIKKTKGGRSLIKDWFIERKQQIHKKLGSPVIFVK